MMMKPLVLVFLFCCVIISVSVMITWKPDQDLERLAKAQEFECVYEARFSPAQRKQFYPFNSSARIYLVSFSNEKDTDPARTLIPEFTNPDSSVIKEMHELSGSQIDSLTDILFNIAYKGQTSSLPIAMCFIPRNAIIFQDMEGKVFDYIQICFECQEIRASSAKIGIGDFCEKKMEALRLLFSQVGMKYGMEEIGS
jgi:hypothetical protein